MWLLLLGIPVGWMARKWFVEKKPAAIGSWTDDAWGDGSGDWAYWSATSYGRGALVKYKDDGKFYRAKNVITLDPISMKYTIPPPNNPTDWSVLP